MEVYVLNKEWTGSNKEKLHEVKCKNNNFNRKEDGAFLHGASRRGSLRLKYYGSPNTAC